VAERKAAEAKVAEVKAAEARAAEQKAAEAKEAKRKAAEAKAAERKAIEAKEAERKAAEARAAETRAAEKKLADAQAAVRTVAVKTVAVKTVAVAPSAEPAKPDKTLEAAKAADKYRLNLAAAQKMTLCRENCVRTKMEKDEILGCAADCAKSLAASRGVSHEYFKVCDESYVKCLEGMCRYQKFHFRAWRNFLAFQGPCIANCVRTNESCLTDIFDKRSR
jgi:hypothetical protein